MRKWIFAGLAALAAAQAAADCKLVRIEEWQVRTERNLPIIDGEINGTKVGILVDTGAQRTFITRSAVGRMMLNRAEVAPADPSVGRDRAIESVRIEQLAAHIEAGVEHIVFVPHDYRPEQLDIIAEEIIPRLPRRATGVTA